MPNISRQWEQFECSVARMEERKAMTTSERRMELLRAIIKFRDAAYSHGWARCRKDHDPLDSTVTYNLAQAVKQVKVREDELVAVIDEYIGEVNR